MNTFDFFIMSFPQYHDNFHFKKGILLNKIEKYKSMSAFKQKSFRMHSRIIRRLRHVNVIIRMNGIFTAKRAPKKF